MRHTFIIADAEYEVWLSRQGEGYVLHVGEQAVPVALSVDGETLRAGEETSPVLIAADDDLVHIHIDGATHTVRYVDPVRQGKSRPLLSTAVFTRSRLSFTAASGRPTMLKQGKPLAASTSTCTRYASTPINAALFTWLNMAFSFS